MKYLYLLFLTISIIAFPIKINANEYINMEGFEILENQLKSDPINNEKDTITNSEQPRVADKKVEALNYCISTLELINKHYETLEYVQNILIFKATSSLGIQTIQREYKNTLDNYNDYGKKIKIACENSYPKISYVEQHFQLASEVVDNYLTQYGY